MSNFLAIATVTSALSRLIQASVGIDVPGAVATTVRPDGPAGGTPDIGVNVYLYQATPNPHWRNHDLPMRRADGALVNLPQAAYDLHYLLSFYGTEADLEPQRLLGSTVRALHAQPILSRDLIENAIAEEAFLIGSDLADEIETVKITPIPLNLEELSKLWSVFFQTSYVLSIAYMASVVLISPDAQPVLAQQVLEPVITVGPTLDQGGVTPAAPDTVAGLQMWLSAGVYVDHDEHAFVASWTDQSGNGNDASQSEQARKPIYVRNALNGKPVIRFDGADDYLAIENLNYNTSGAIAGITVMALIKSSSSVDQIIVAFDRNEYWRLALSGGTGDIRWGTHAADGSTHNLGSSEPYTDAGWHVISAVFDASASPDKQLFIDGEIVAQEDGHGGSNLGSGVTRFGFIGVGSEAEVFDGTLGPESYLNGDLAELILFDRAVSVEERQQVEQYIVEEYS